MVSPFIDSGAGIVLSLVCFSPSIYDENKYINVRLMMCILCNERTNCLRVYKRLLTNRLHGKAAELCLLKYVIV